ncbi:MAG: hypothetical protein ACT4P7_19125 [Gemmatimonadaceae bacterium]
MAEAARTVGLNETSEGGFFLENVGFIMDGQTGWEHAFSDVPMYSDGAKFFGKAGGTYSPTLVVAGPGAWSIEYWLQESDVWKDAKQRKWFPWRALVPHTRVRSQRAGDRLLGERGRATDELEGDGYVRQGEEAVETGDEHDGKARHHMGGRDLRFEAGTTSFHRAQLARYRATGAATMLPHSVHDPS